EVRYEDWKNNPERVFSTVKQQIGLPIVLKAPHQASSIGVAIVKQDDFEAFSKGINQCFLLFPSQERPGINWMPRKRNNGQMPKQSSKVASDIPYMWTISPYIVPMSY